ncbi:MAG: hypothetical protein ACKVZH_19240 [Blastocatellia bacterium]
MKNGSNFRPLAAIACMVILAVLSVGIPQYLQVRKRQQNKDVILQQSLWAIRKSVEFYTTDFKKPPKSLQDLIDTNYLRKIPIDPFTQSDKTWVIEKRSGSSQLDSESGIVDVHSSAAGADASGKPYNQY